MVFWILLISYLIGSIPFGLLLTKYVLKQDIRTVGSGNIGATNVLRTGNQNLAALTLVLDALKGLFPVMLGNVFLEDHAAWAGLFAVLGHMHPIWLGFKGGKGVATGIGVYFGLNFWLGLIVGGIWLGTAYYKRISSLAALVAYSIAPFLGLFLKIPVAFVPMLIVSSLILYKHKTNIGRLRAGIEPNIDLKRNPPKQKKPPKAPAKKPLKNKVKKKK